MKIAVSACLLGEKIRYDGGHKRCRFITDNLSKYMTFVPFCPEHMAFGTPRESMHLVAEGGRTRVTTNFTHQEITRPLVEASRAEYARIAQEPICGIILKAKSPSCAMTSTKYHLPDGTFAYKGAGLFAQTCMEGFAHLPMEEEGRLEDAWLRENFVMQLFAYERMRRFREAAATHGDLVRFHTQEKYLLLSKSRARYEKLGRLVAEGAKLTSKELIGAYAERFNETIAQKSSIGKSVNVLQHIAGFFKQVVDKEEKAALHRLIGQFEDGIVPIIVPVAALKLYAGKHNVAWLLEQTYLDPYPEALALRSHLTSVKPAKP